MIKLPSIWQARNGGMSFGLILIVKSSAT
jgi:hypothetical protein